MIECYCVVEGCGGDCRNGARCMFEYVAADYPEAHRWKGPGDPPAIWNAGDAVVYRSYVDWTEFS